MEVDKSMALTMVKARLNRLEGDTSLDDYLEALIDAAAEELEGIGIHLLSTAEDLMLLVDKTVINYHNRDKPGGDPEWFRLKRRERWLRERRCSG